MATGIQKTKWNGTVIIDEHADDFSDMDPGAMELHYPGKLDRDTVLSTPPAEVAQVWQGTSDTNRLYFGDNLSLLAALLQDPAMRGQVRLVYIDPPFATNSVFKSRKQSEAYSDTLVGTHFVEFLRRRLILLHELLADDGSIYIHLDQTMVFHIKLIMDEIFGRQNLRNLITRKKCNPKNYTRKTYGNISDHILYYAKSSSPVWNRAYKPWSVERAMEEYSSVEEETGRLFKKVPVHAPGTRNGETGKPWKGMNPPPGKHWQYTPAKLDEMDARGEIYWSPTGNPRRKIYLDQSPGIPVQDIWLEFRDAHNQMVKITGYPTEKNPDLLARIIEASSNPGDLVLDCFSGSGTTIAEASRLGRHWIGMDNSSEAIITTLERFAYGLKPMGDFVSKPQPQPTLFEFADIELSQPDSESHHPDVVDDFTLYSTQAQGATLKQAIGLAP